MTVPHSRDGVAIVNALARTNDLLASILARLDAEGTDQSDIDSCHCGAPYVVHEGGTGGRYTRYLCEHCDAVRCDAYPGECGR